MGAGAKEGFSGSAAAPALPEAPWMGSKGVGARTRVGCGKETAWACVWVSVPAHGDIRPGVGLVGISERSRFLWGKTPGLQPPIPIPEPLGCIPADPGALGGVLCSPAKMLGTQRKWAAANRKSKLPPKRRRRRP